MEEKEKAGIMPREEQIGMESVRKMLSDFKKDLLKCLEGYLAGWTPPSVVVNGAKKGAVIGGPKLRKEKPKPPIKLTYFRIGRKLNDLKQLRSIVLSQALPRQTSLLAQ